MMPLKLLSCLLISAFCFTSSAWAKGPLWLVGDPKLRSQTDSTQIGAWVPTVFDEVVGDAQTMINEIAADDTEFGDPWAPRVLIIWVDSNDQLLGDTITAFNDSGAGVVVAKKANLVASGGGRGRRGGGGGDTSVEEADIVWIMDGSPKNYNGTSGLNFFAREKIKAHFGASAAGAKKASVVGGQGRAATLLGEVFLEEANGNGEWKAGEALQGKSFDSVPLVTNFLELLPNTLIDSDFLQNGGIARLPVMIARAEEEHGFLVGIGVDDATALRVEFPEAESRSPIGFTATVFGGGSVTLQGIDPDTQTSLVTGLSPHITDLVHHQVTEGYQITTAGNGIANVQIKASSTAITVPLLTPADAVYFWPVKPVLDSIGKAEYGKKGSMYYPDFFSGDSNAIFKGEVDLVPGTEELRNTIYASNMFSGASWGTKTGTLLFAIADKPGRSAIWVTTGQKVQLETPATVKNQVCNFCTAGDARSILVLDTMEVSSVDFSNYYAQGAGNARQSVALVGGRLHVVAWGESVDLHDLSTCQLVADVDGNESLNVIDVQYVIMAQGSAPVPPDMPEDMNHDGKVDIDDVNIAIQCALGAM